ncbi:AMP-binding protein [Pseudorhodoferax sp. LjRoot39]|uniref:AMP-binding protein n=1 Tax=Pseudorhodoferax sp. LjRoot39 TaxID=3342328 RepID=UPI003ECD8C00
MNTTSPAAATGIRFAPKEVHLERRTDGSILLRSPIALSGCADNIVDYLERWAAAAPDRVFLAQRAPGGGWETLCYAEAWRRVQAVAQALLDRGLHQDTPIAILSGASLEHAVLTFAGMLAGVPVSPVSPNYTLLAPARPRLAEIAELLQPGLVFAQDVERFSGARAVPALARAPWLSASVGAPGTETLASLYGTAPGPAVAAARRKVQASTVAKILFTSGSTGSPKGVLNTHGMLCSAVQASGLVVSSEQVPVGLDWLPWHHTVGGNATLHGILREGGTLYIDDGRPTPAEFHKTIANIREVRPTSLLSVPSALQMLADALEADDELRLAFFSRLRRMNYAGASLPQEVWNRMQALAVRTLGHQIAFGAGYGTTETGPGISITHWPSEGGGEIGLPLPGLTVKLVPFEDRYEVRARGPNVTPGYLHRPDLTAAAFDEENFYRVGDLVQFANPERPEDGLRFAGRLSENFKLSNGSWVATGDLRLALVEACQPLLTDLVIAGPDRDDIRLLVWVHPAERQRAGASAEGELAPPAYAPIAARVAERLRAHNRQAGGPTHRVAAFRILHMPASIGAGETTDKGYVNQRGVLACRAALVAELYSASPGPEVVQL